MPDRKVITVSGEGVLNGVWLGMRCQGLQTLTLFKTRDLVFVAQTYTQSLKENLHDHFN